MFCDVELSGSFTTPASGNAAQTLKLPFVPDLIEVWIRGNTDGSVWESVANPGPVKYAMWQSGMASASALTTRNTNGAATDTSDFISVGGFTPVVSAANSLGVAQAGSGITRANPGVMTLTNSNVYATGDVVLLESTTASLQLSGVPWSVVSTGATTYNLGIVGNELITDNTAIYGINVPAATNVVAKKVNFPTVMFPYVSFIRFVTLGGSTLSASGNPVVPGSQTGITTTAPHGLSVGDTVRLVIPSPWGSTQISGQQGIITSVPDTISFIVNIDSSAASAFVYPTTAQAGAGVTWPQVIPFGDQASSFNLSATDNDFQGIIIGNSATAGAAILSANSALVVWRAQKSARVYTSTTS